MMSDLANRPPEALEPFGAWNKLNLEKNLVIPGQLLMNLIAKHQVNY